MLTRTGRSSLPPRRAVPSLCAKGSLSPARFEVATGDVALSGATIAGAPLLVTPPEAGAIVAWAMASGDSAAVHSRARAIERAIANEALLVVKKPPTGGAFLFSLSLSLSLSPSLTRIRTRTS